MKRRTLLAGGIAAASLAAPARGAPRAALPAGFRPLPAPRPSAASVPGGTPYASLIDSAARSAGVDPALVAAVAQAESGFNPRAQSGAGAKGLMQLMDGTARGLGVRDAFDPGQNLAGGARFLSSLLKQFHGDVRLALAAYNAGPGAVQRYGGVPPYEETQRYVPKVLGLYEQFRRRWSATAPEDGVV